MTILDELKKERKEIEETTKKQGHTTAFQYGRWLSLNQEIWNITGDSVEYWGD